MRSSLCLGLRLLFSHFLLADLGGPVDGYEIHKAASVDSFCQAVRRVHVATAMSAVECFTASSTPPSSTVSIGQLSSLALDIDATGSFYSFAGASAQKNSSEEFWSYTTSLPWYDSKLPSLRQGMGIFKNLTAPPPPPLPPASPDNSAFTAAASDVALFPNRTGFCQVNAAPLIGPSGASYIEFFCVDNYTYIQSSYYTTNSYSSVELFAVDYVRVAVSPVADMACFAATLKHFQPVANMNHTVQIFCTTSNSFAFNVAPDRFFTNISANFYDYLSDFYLHDLELDFSPSGIPCYSLSFERVDPRTNTPGQIFFEFKCGIGNPAMIDSTPKHGLILATTRVYDSDFVFIGANQFCLALSSDINLDIFCGVIGGSSFNHFQVVPNYESFQVLLAKNSAEDGVCAVGISYYGGIDSFLCANLTTRLHYDLVNTNWWDLVTDRFFSLDLFFTPLGLVRSRLRSSCLILSVSRAYWASVSRRP